MVKIENLSVIIINTSLCFDNCAMTVLAASAALVMGVSENEEKTASAANTHCISLTNTILATCITA